MDEKLNFVATGGEFGRRRRIPGYILSRDNSDNIIVTSERDHKYRWVGKSVEQAEKAHEYLVDKASLSKEDLAKKYKIKWT